MLRVQYYTLVRLHDYIRAAVECIQSHKISRAHSFPSRQKFGFDTGIFKKETGIDIKFKSILTTQRMI